MEQQTLTIDGIANFLAQLPKLDGNNAIKLKQILRYKHALRSRNID